MASRWTELVVDCHDAELLAEFWCGVLGWEVIDRDDGDVEIGDGRDGPTILFGPVPDTKTIKNRLHIDLRATDRERDEEVARVVALGAREIDIGQGDVSWVVLADPEGESRKPDIDWVVLADPEGNEFCVLAGPPRRGELTAVDEKPEDDSD